MSAPAPELAPRRAIGGVVAVWVLAALAGIAIGVFVAEESRATWLIAGMGGCLVLSFAIQLWYGRSQQFIDRVAASALGALVVMGLISAIFGLAAIIPG